VVDQDVPEVPWHLVMATPHWKVFVQPMSATAQAHAPFIRLWTVCLDLDYPGLLAKVVEKHPGIGLAEVGLALLGSWSC